MPASGQVVQWMWNFEVGLVPRGGRWSKDAVVERIEKQDDLPGLRQDHKEGGTG